jgi:outer membrane protein, multidrug efflux system
MKRAHLTALFFLSGFAATPPASAQPASAPAVANHPVAAAVPPMSDTETLLTAPESAERSLHSWSEAADLLRSRSADLRIALDEVIRADAQARTALAALLPTVNGSLNLSHQFITNQGSQLCKDNGRDALCPIDVPQTNALDGTLSAAMPLINVRAWYNLKTAKRAQEATQFSVDDVKRTLLLAVVSAMISVFTTERIADLNRIGLQNAIDRKALATKRKELDAGTRLDVVRATQDVEAARATVVTGNESLRQARESLGLALGVPTALGVAHDLDLRTLEASAQQVCKDQGSIDGRADIAALKARAALAGRAHSEVGLQFLPTLSISSGVNTTTRETGVAPRTTWDVRGLLSWNIWDGGARYGALRDTAAQQDQSEMRLEAQRRRATIEVVQARRGISVAENSRAIAEAKPTSSRARHSQRAAARVSSSSPLRPRYAKRRYNSHYASSSWFAQDF